MKANIPKEVDDTARLFLASLSSIRQEQINTVPFPGSWTAGQIAEHILLSASGVLEVIHGPVKPTERDPSQHAEQIQKMFLDFSTKMVSPDFVRPSSTPKDKAVLLQSLQKTMGGIRSVAATQDLTATCMGFEFPGFGDLTRSEWIAFILAHTLRHTHQLNKIAEKLQPHANSRPVES
jgi:hypothetical protein